MRRATTLGAATVMTLLMLTGCSSGDNATSGRGEAAAPRDADGGGVDGGGAADGGDAADDGGDAQEAAGSGGLIEPAAFTASVGDIIYTVDLTIRTGDVAESARTAADIAADSGGFVADEQADDHSATLTLRVPSQAHTEIVTKLEDLGEVTDRNRTAEDVTQEVADTKSRIASQRASIERIRALMNKATNLGDIVDIESELAAREADLDALLSRQQELAGLTSLATVTVSLLEKSEDPPQQDDDTYGGFLSGLGSGWSAFVAAGSVALTIAGALVPFVVLGLLVGIPVVVLVRRRRASGSTPPPETPPAQAPAA